MTKEEWNEAVRTYIREHGEKHNDDYWIDNSVLFEFLKTLPPVTPARKKGHWIDLNMNHDGHCDDYGHPYVKCSECGCINGIDDSDFCPDCFKAITAKQPEPKKKRERLTDSCWRNFDPWECCGLGEDCKRDAHDKNGCCNGCKVPKLYARLAEYEDREEKGAEI